MKKYILFNLLVLLLFSCKRNKTELEDNTDIIGRMFAMPDTIEYIEKGTFFKESSVEFMKSFKDSPIILSFIWGDCHVCVHKLLQWSGLITEEVFGDNVKYLFVVMVSDKKYFLRTFYEPIDNIPVLLVDTNETLLKKNNLNFDPEYNTFLLNRDSKIVIQGNPLYNNDLFILYKEKVMIL